MTPERFQKSGVILACVIVLLSSPVIFLSGCNPNTSTKPAVNTPAGDYEIKGLEAQAAMIIRQGLGSKEPQLRTTAIEVAAGTNQTQFMPDIQRLLVDEFVPVRFAAEVAIGDARYRAAKGEVSKLLKDNDENVRIAAGYAIYKLGSKAGLTPVLKAITSSNQRVRANAAFLSGKSGDRSALPMLYEAIRDGASDDRVRLNSVEAIARLGDEGIYQKLWAMLISAYADDRVFGIQAMGALGTAAARDSISTMLKDDLVEVRLTAAEQLGRLGDTAGERVVLDALEQRNTITDREERVRLETLAAMATGQIKTPGLKKFLPELVKNESQFVRLAAAKAVFQCAGGGNIGQ